MLATKKYQQCCTGRTWVVPPGTGSFNNTCHKKKGSSLQGVCCLCAVVCIPLRVCVHQHMYVHTTLHSCMSCMFSVYTQPNKMLKDNTTRYTRKRRKSNSQPDFHEPGHITACVTVYTFILKFNSKVLHKIEY
jgi:hypothetical protein